MSWLVLVLWIVFVGSVVTVILFSVNQASEFIEVGGYSWLFIVIFGILALVSFGFLYRWKHDRILFAQLDQNTKQFNELVEKKSRGQVSEMEAEKELEKLKQEQKTIYSKNKLAGEGILEFQ